MYQPEMPGVGTVKIVKAFESVKEPSPLSYKMGTDLYPEAFDASVVRGSVVDIIGSINSNNNMKNVQPPYERGTVWTICHDHEDRHILILTSSISTHPRRHTMCLYCIEKN
jgi:hypothetical protein